MATFVLAVIGVVLSALSLGWQAASFVLTGGRVKVQLWLGAMHHEGAGLVTGPPGQISQEWIKRTAEQGFTRPVVTVRVRNVGRMPVTVERWSIVTVFRRQPAQSLLGAIDARRGSRPEGPAMTPIGISMGPPLPHRLDAYASETWAMAASEVRALLVSTRETFKQDAVSVVGQVELGNGRTYRSAEMIDF